MRLRDFEEWLTPAEAGEVIGISKQAVVKRLYEDTIRGIKTHQGWLVDPKDARRVRDQRKARG